MKSNILSKISLFAGGLSVMLSSCYVMKPDSNGASALDYNSRTEVYNPHYKRVISPVGYGVIALTTAGGAYLGMQSNIIQTQKGSERVANKPAGAIIGGVAALGINLLINKSFKVREQKPLDNFDKWLKNANSNYIPLEKSLSGYRAILENAENTYTVKVLKDVTDFKYAFPTSTYSSQVVLGSAASLDRYDLPDVIAMYPNDPNIIEAKKAYVLKSASVEDVISASKKYPQTELDIENIAFGKINNSTEALSFNRYYPNSKHTNEAFCIGLKTLSPSSYPTYIAAFNNVEGSLVEKTKKSYVESSSTIQQFYDAGKLYPQYKILSQDLAMQKLNSNSDYEDYLRLFKGTKNCNVVDSKYGKIIKNEFKNINENDELANYEFEMKYKKSECTAGLMYAMLARANYITINESGKADAEAAMKFNEGHTLVKIVFKMRDKSPAKKIMGPLVNEMRQREQTSFFGLFGGGEKNFRSIDDVRTYYETGIINASWYRAGTEKDGSWLVQNSGFPKFKKDFESYANSNNMEIVYCEYLGSYRDDERKAEERKQAVIQFKQEQCSKCEIDWKKSKNPEDVQHWLWGKVHNSGKIVMKNGDAYEFDVNDGKCKISDGWFSSKSFNSYYEMLDDFKNKCKEKYCQ